MWVGGGGLAPYCGSTALGIGGGAGTNGPTGVVFKVNAAYSGFENRAVWEWLSQAEKADVLGQGPREHVATDKIRAL